MSLTWNPKRTEKLANRTATVLLVLAAIYFAVHILAAWLRGSLGGWR